MEKQNEENICEVIEFSKSFYNIWFNNRLSYII